MKAYMLVLSGQGDIYVKLVSKEAWEWMDDPRQPVPPSVIEAAVERDDEYDPPNITSGSAVNDAALWLPALVIDDIECQFDGVSDALDFLKKHPDVELCGEFEGYIY